MEANPWIELFVPGRICLFGEHSDWAGGFRRFNEKLEPGMTIVCGTNQGIHARVRRAPKLVLSSVDHLGKRVGSRVVEMSPKALLAEAKTGSFWSYAAGVAYKVSTDSHVGGIEVDNYRTTLPMSKGLSSSAAMCVLVARAFSRLYEIKMTLRGEMEYAYQGELVTPSRCGRMDQGCAFGCRPILMTYDGDFVDVEELRLAPDVPSDAADGDAAAPAAAPETTGAAADAGAIVADGDDGVGVSALHYVMVDLAGSKSTTAILAGLQAAYPFPQTDAQRRVVDTLGAFNLDVCARAVALLRAGDAKGLGALMVEAQARFDRDMQPACPEQLTMPLLHALLEHKPLAPLVWGGKGVGSQGDGSAQLLCRSKAAQKAVLEMVPRDFPGMTALPLTIEAATPVRVAVVTAAGFEPALYPVSHATSPLLFPLIDRDGVSRPVLLRVCEELFDAGLARIVVLVAPQERAILERLFAPLAPARLNALTSTAKQYSRKVVEIGSRVEFVVQETQEGLGHAVLTARDAVRRAAALAAGGDAPGDGDGDGGAAGANEPFLLVLGDHVYRSTCADGSSCVAQLLAAHRRQRGTLVALRVSTSDEVSRRGVFTGSWIKERVLSDAADGADAAAAPPPLKKSRRAPPSALAGRMMRVTDVIEKPDLETARASFRFDHTKDDDFLTAFGLYVLPPSVFPPLERAMQHNVRTHGSVQLTPVLATLASDDPGGLTGFVIEGERFDLETPKHYLETLREFAN